VPIGLTCWAARCDSIAANAHPVASAGDELVWAWHLLCPGVSVCALQLCQVHVKQIAPDLHVLEFRLKLAARERTCAFRPGAHEVSPGRSSWSGVSGWSRACPWSSSALACGAAWRLRTNCYCCSVCTPGCPYHLLRGRLSTANSMTFGKPTKSR